MKIGPHQAVLMFLLTGGAEVQGFVAAPPTPSSMIVSKTSRVVLCSTTKQNNNSQKRNVQYGEESRRYRRDVFTHEDWVKFRADDRFIRNLTTIFSSGIYRNIAGQVLWTVVVAIFVVVFNALVGDTYIDLEGIEQTCMYKGMFPMLVAPLTPFSLSVSSLGFLLVFRTNNSYKRWDEARKNWGMNINHTRDLVRMGNAYYDREGVSDKIVQEDLNRLALCTWAFCRAMKRHLSPEWEDEEDFKNEVREKLPKEQAAALIDAKHRPNRALQDLSFAIESLPMNFIRKNELQKSLTIFENNLGSSERLLTSPVPLFYTRHTARFTSLWLLLLPLGLYSLYGETWNHVGLIPTTGAISTALFSIEELATQLEEPFTILPMQNFCDKIYKWCMEIVSFQPGNDNDLFDEEYLWEVAALKTSSDVNGYNRQQYMGGLGNILGDTSSASNQKERLPRSFLKP